VEVIEWPGRSAGRLSNVAGEVTAMGFRLGLRQRPRVDRPHLLVSRYRTQAEYERDARRLLADGWRMSGWQRLDLSIPAGGEPREPSGDTIIATWVREDA
jgi:hypothetical protein